MIIILSLVTSAKDYFEVVHKLMEFHPNYSIADYNELGSIISYLILTIKSFFTEFFSLNWLHTLWSIPIFVPDISSAMISEISVLDGYFHNAFTFLETPFSYGKHNYSIYGLEKFTIGLINSFFLFLPTSAAHIILLRRFVFQGIEAGYLAGIGIIAGNMFWLTSIILGWRFFVIPWISLDILRYLLGFIILIKYMWHASRDERRTSVATNLSKSKIILVNFLLALTEQTSIYPFVTNISVGAESSILETFPVDNLTQFIFIHSAYLLGILAGSLSFLHLTCWLWENPIYKIYIWFISNSSFSLNVSKGPKTNYYKYLNFSFLYLTMLCTIASIPYFGLDYTLTNPLGFSYDDRILYQNNKKTNLELILPETAFLSSQASDRNTRDSRGRHGRRERWKERLIKYRGMDTALYDQGVYDLLTIEDLNYGFDKFWLRRKIKNHHSRFRMVIFQPWLLSLKKQLAKPRLISNEGVRVELFRMLYEQFYHPNFHAYLRFPPSSISNSLDNVRDTNNSLEKTVNALNKQNGISKDDTLHNGDHGFTIKKNKSAIPNVYNFGISGLQSRSKIDNKLTKEFSALRKLVRKINTRMKSSEIFLNTTNLTDLNKPIYSKRWKQVLSKLPAFPAKIKTFNQPLWGYISTKNLKIPVNDFKENWQKLNIKGDYFEFNSVNNGQSSLNNSYNKKNNIETNYMQKEKLSKKDRQLLRYKTIFTNANKIKTNFRKTQGSLFLKGASSQKALNNANTMLHPIKFYLQKEKAFRRKLQFYGASVFRKLSIENNAPYFRIMMKRLFYYYKPTLRWTNTLKLARNKQGHKVRRKKSRTPLLFQPNERLTELATQTTTGVLRENLLSKREIKQAAPYSPPLGGKGLHDQTITTVLLTPKRLAAQSNKGPVKTTSLSLKEPTHKFRVVGKNASRYRYQIYKDVLHHWYYTPFNRLLLKLDVDSFIRRQPNTHFLTKKEEQQLHLKRYLLAEHYETLRWYTYMQHYRSMKTKIGGTKSFASRMYNHQFQGTLKKIRHLFAITPSLLSTEASQSAGILKFDQPLYNEYSNTEQKSIIKASVTHEELFVTFNKQSLSLLKKTNLDSLKLSPLALESKVTNENRFKAKETNTNDLTTKMLGQELISNKLSITNLKKDKTKDDLITQSKLIVRQYLKTSKPIRQAKIKQLILKHHYKELTQFIFSGQKNRGIKAITNQRSLLNQEKNYLYKKQELAPLFHSPPEEGGGNGRGTPPSFTFLPPFGGKAKQSGGAEEGERLKNIELSHFLKTTAKNMQIEQDLWFNLLKNYKKGLYDQEFLTKFVERRVKKREKRQQKKEKELKNRLKRLQNWLKPNPFSRAKFQNNHEEALAVYASQKNLTPDLLTTGIKNAIKDGFLINSSTKDPYMNRKRNVLVEVELSNISSAPTPPEKMGLKGLKTNGVSETVTHSLQSISSILKTLNKEKETRKKKTLLSSTKNLFLTAFVKTKVVSKSLQNTIKNILELILEDAKRKILKPIATKDPKWWDIKDKMLKKRKRSRKKYTKEIKKAQNTYINLMKEQKKEAERVEPTTKKTKETTQVQKSINNQAFLNSFFLGLDKKQNDNKFSFTPIKMEQKNPSSPPMQRIDKGGKGAKPHKDPTFYEKQTSPKVYSISNLSQNIPGLFPPISTFSMENKSKEDQGKLIDQKGVKDKVEVLNERKKRLSDNSPLPHSPPPLINALLSLPFPPPRGGGDQREEEVGRGGTGKRVKNEPLSLPLEKKLAFLYFNTLYGKKYEIKQQFRRKKTKNRRNQRFGRPHHRVEHPSYNATLERKSANMLPEKRLETLKDIYKKSFIHSELFTLHTSFPKKRKSKKRNWKKYKKGINSEKTRKARKQNRDAIALQRAGALSKQIKRIKLNLKLQQWWWQKFLPNIQATAEATWQLEKDRQLKKTISQLSKTEILERDLSNTNRTLIPPLGEKGLANFQQDLQIGNYDFKPLVIPQALRIRDDLIKKNLLRINGSNFSEKNDSSITINTTPMQNIDKGLDKKGVITEVIPIPPNGGKGLKNGSLEKKRNSLFYNHNNRLLLFFAKLKKSELKDKKYVENQTFLIPIPPNGGKGLVNKLYTKIFEKHSTLLQTKESYLQPEISLKNTLARSSPFFLLPPFGGKEAKPFGSLASLGKGEITKQKTPFKIISSFIEKVAKTSVAEKDFSLIIKKRTLSPNKKDKSGLRLDILNNGEARNKFLVQTNSLPFYAGWDESLRKFVVTNRLLSRRDAGYSVTLLSSSEAKSRLAGVPKGTNSKIEFTNAPLQGMNAGTTLYCQVPFTTFDPDQLFSKGMDGFAPIGWRRFEFTHTIFKKKAKTKAWRQLRSTKSSSTSLPFFVKIKKQSFAMKPLLIKQISIQHIDKNSVLIPQNQALFSTPKSLAKLNENKDFNIWLRTNGMQGITNTMNYTVLEKLKNRAQMISFKKTYSMGQSPSLIPPLGGKGIETIKKSNNYSRRLKKHYKRIKKLQNEKVPVFLMSGPLINEVLPIHYINVFNKQNRLSRDRYLKRRLRRGKKGVPKAIKEFNTKNAELAKIGSYDAYASHNDFTLRRRIKTRRKYHRKPPNTKGIEVRPRRHKFLADFNTNSYLAINNREKQLSLITKNKKPIRKRPSKRQTKKNQSGAAKNARDYDGGLSTKARQRKNIKKTGALNARLRQLRRRVSRQVIKPVPRRRPRSGGFLWPGDYLRLEQTESPTLMLKNTQPKLDSLKSSSSLPISTKDKEVNGSPLNSDTLALKDIITDSNKQKITRKIDKKAILLDLYVQPRKYLLEKHNIKVIKKKLEKAQRTNKIKQRLQALALESVF